MPGAGTAARAAIPLDPGLAAGALRVALAGLVLAGVLVAGLYFGAARVVVRDVQDEETVIARLVAGDIARTKAAARLVVAHVAEQIERDSRTGAADPRAAIDRLTPFLAIDDELYALKLLAADGAVLAATGAVGAVAASGARLDIPRDPGSGATRLLGAESRSVVDSRPVLHLGRPIDTDDPDGPAWIVVSINLDAIRSAVETSVSLRDRVLIVAQADAAPLFAIARDETAIPGRPLALGAGADGVYEAAWRHGEGVRIGGFARAADGAVLVLSTRPKTAAMREAMIDHAPVLLAGLGALCAAIFLAVLALAQLRQRERLLAEYGRLTQTMDLAGIGIAVLSWPGARIERASRAFLRRFGYDARELRARPFDFLLGPGTDDAAAARLFERIRAGRRGHADLLVYAKDRKAAWAEIRTAPVRGPDGRISAVLATAIDITQRVDLEVRLRTLLDRANAANKAKDSFLARMSHELRTPLNAIIGYAEMMELRIKGPIPDGYRAYPGDIASSGRHLLGLIDDLLEMARLEQGARRLKRERVDLRRTVEAAIILCAEALDRRGARIDVAHESAAMAEGDPLALRQVVVNLVVNAARYGAKGGTVSVRTRRIPGGLLELAVSDDGPGFPADILERIGEPFLGRASATSNDGGLGLGLAIVVELVRRMDGLVVAENPVGGGARVIVELHAFEDQAGV